MKQENYRLLLSFLFRVLVFVGLLLILSPFIVNLFTTDKFLNLKSNNILEFSLRALKPGEIKKVTVGPIPIWIYARKDTEIEQLTHMSSLLADPFSTLSRQPKVLQHPTRAYDDHYFVFKPIESIRSCSIRYLENPSITLEQLLSQKNINWQGGFTESCFGSVYDLAGRRYRGTGKKNQQNLDVPEYSIKNTKQQGDVIQFDFKLLVAN